MWCFDLLLLNGNDLRSMPLVAGKLRLEALLWRDHLGWLYSESFTNPELLPFECRKRGLEGIVSKKKTRPIDRANAIGSKSNARSGVKRIKIEAIFSSSAVKSGRRFVNSTNCSAAADRHHELAIISWPHADVVSA